jgi:hypothetical protein
MKTFQKLTVLMSMLCLVVLQLSSFQNELA